MLEQSEQARRDSIAGGFKPRADIEHAVVGELSFREQAPVDPGIAEYAQQVFAAATPALERSLDTIVPNTARALLACLEGRTRFDLILSVLIAGDHVAPLEHV